MPNSQSIFAKGPIEITEESIKKVAEYLGPVQVPVAEPENKGPNNKAFLDLMNVSAGKTDRLKKFNSPDTDTSEKKPFPKASFTASQLYQTKK